MGHFLTNSVFGALISRSHLPRGFCLRVDNICDRHDGHNMAEGTYIPHMNLTNLPFYGCNLHQCFAIRDLLAHPLHPVSTPPRTKPPEGVRPPHSLRERSVLPHNRAQILRLLIQVRLIRRLDGRKFDLSLLYSLSSSLIPSPYDPTSTSYPPPSTRGVIGMAW